MSASRKLGSQREAGATGRKGTWPGTMLKAKQRAALVAMRMSLPTTAFPPVIRAVGQALLSLLLYVLRDQ